MGIRAVADGVIFGTKGSRALMEASHGVYNTGNPELDQALSLTARFGYYTPSQILTHVMCAVRDGLGMPDYLHVELGVTHSPTFPRYPMQEDHTLCMVFPPPVQQTILGLKFTVGGYYQAAATSLQQYSGIVAGSLVGRSADDTLMTADVIGLMQYMGYGSKYGVTAGMKVTVEDPAWPDIIQESVSYPSHSTARVSDYTPHTLGNPIPAIWYLGVPFVAELQIMQIESRPSLATLHLADYGRASAGAAVPRYGEWLPPLSMTIDGASAVLSMRDWVRRVAQLPPNTLSNTPQTINMAVVFVKQVILASIGHVALAWTAMPILNVDHGNVNLPTTMSAPDIQLIWSKEGKLPAALIRLIGVPGAAPPAPPLKGGEKPKVKSPASHPLVDVADATAKGADNPEGEAEAAVEQVFQS